MPCYCCQNSDTNVPTFVASSQYWNIFLNPDQSYLGRMVVVAKRHVSSLSELSTKEQVDFFTIVKKVELAVVAAFGADLVNWTCLMNDAFQERKSEPHVHWHVRPRYGRAVKIEGRKFIDAEFGHHYDWKRKVKINDDLIKSIVGKIRENW